MARKANIAREEIHQACWELLEKNQFPNIPRIADYFLDKDGRKCSNTTLMNAISEWEELYKEHQQHQLKELGSSLAPSFNRFSRDVTQILGRLLDEKMLDAEAQYALRLSATEGQYSSLSLALCELQDAYDAVLEERESLKVMNTQLNEHLKLTQQRYDDVYSHHQVINNQLTRERSEKEALRLNLDQHEVDLAKQDHLISSLKEENSTLKQQVKSLQEEQRSVDKQHRQAVDQTLQEIARTMKQIQGKDRDNK
ncbi:hypothetical protein [Marinomonas spartinae]|uniref:hypothetical protein n=1 Tax=Marinomonas spartinae TaxID=1792290 RepID=UPI0018F26990|nr:hypothetical protein [Marinomonas spartinae]MBJ7556914.1 hypothetical protein [Marinomonas spartinae]